MTLKGENDPIEYKQYRRRYWYAIVVIVLNLSNAMTWICFAPITYHTAAYYGNDLAPTLFNIVFMVFSIPFGMIAVWFMDRFGLRWGIYFGATLNLVGNIIRFGASGSFCPKNLRFAIAFTGQSIAAVSQPFIMYLPTKLTGFWFPDTQRNLANTLTSMSNPVGIAIQYGISPVIVNNLNSENFFTLTGITLGTAILSFLMSLTVTRSEPPTPVSGSKASTVKTPNCCGGLRMSCCSPQFMLLGVCLGGGVGLFNALYNNLQPALCTKGYSETFNGLMGGLLILAGLVGAFISGMIVDRHKEWTEYVIKIAFCLAGVGACSLTVAINYVDVQWWIILSLIIFGVGGFAVYPVGLETGVEITFPVAESMSTGVIIILGQLQGIIYVVITGLANVKVKASDLAGQTCSTHTSEQGSIVDWKYSFIVWNACIFVLITLMTIFFRPKLNRMAHDKKLETLSEMVEKEERVHMVDDKSLSSVES